MILFSATISSKIDKGNPNKCMWNATRNAIILGKLLIGESVGLGSTGSPQTRVPNINKTGSLGICLKFNSIEFKYL